MRNAFAEVVTGIRLLDADPNLAGALTGQSLTEAVIRSLVATWTLRAGRWNQALKIPAGVALYVIQGSLARRVSLGMRSSIELLGPGQVLRPSVGANEQTIGAANSWHVLSPSWLAVLDRSFWDAMAHYPDVTLSLLDRAVSRSRSLTVRLAIVGIRNLQQRILALLWHFADNYGRVGPTGVTLDLALSHDVLAELASARRSSVSKAVKQLEREGPAQPRHRTALHPARPVRATPTLGGGSRVEAGPAGVSHRPATANS